MTTTATVIALDDERDTKFIVETVPVSTGECGLCGKPGVTAVRNTVDQRRPTESTTQRITACVDHQDDATHLRAVWEASARELQDPVKRAEFLAAAGVTG